MLLGGPEPASCPARRWSGRLFPVLEAERGVVSSYPRPTHSQKCAARVLTHQVKNAVHWRWPRGQWARRYWPLKHPTDSQPSNMTKMLHTSSAQLSAAAGGVQPAATPPPSQVHPWISVRELQLTAKTEAGAHPWCKIRPGTIDSVPALPPHLKNKQVTATHRPRSTLIKLLMQEHLWASHASHAHLKNVICNSERSAMLFLSQG